MSGSSYPPLGGHRGFAGHNPIAHGSLITREVAACLLEILVLEFVAVGSGTGPMYVTLSVGG